MKRKKRLRGGGETWEVVRARGHLDEVQELRASVPPGTLHSAHFPLRKPVDREPIRLSSQKLAFSGEFLIHGRALPNARWRVYGMS